MKVLITAGGTGGHIMPAMAIAEALRERMPDMGLLYVGTKRGMEEKAALRYGIDFIGVDAMGVKGKSPAQIARAALVNVSALIRSFGIIRSFRPDWVIGTGGYITGMVVLAGFLCGTRCAIQEQNSIGGLTNRILSRLVHRVFLGFPDPARIFPEKKCTLTGNPVRREIYRPGEYTGKGYLLILGGSLGATSINRAAVDAARMLKQEGHALEVVHQCGTKDLPMVKKAYEDMGLDATVRDFIDDMTTVYSGARMAVCRCGGLTLSELSVMGVPAIMVPFPLAADDHQTGNGRHVESRGGGWIIPDNLLSGERLAMEIRKRFFDEDMLKKASSSIAGLGLGSGSQAIAEEIAHV